MPEQNFNTLRSEGLREFISHRPGILVRWGIPLIFVLLIGMAFGTYYIQYPDIVHARAKVISINAPKQVLTKSRGRLVKLFKEDGVEVKKGDIIGYMENTGDHDEVLGLSEMLDTLLYFADSSRLEEIPGFWHSSNHSFARLGELQPAHQSFMRAFIAFKDYLNTGFYIAKMQMLKQELGNTRRLLTTLYQQKEILQLDLELTQKTYDVHDTLHKESILSDLDYRSQKSQLLAKKMSVPQMNASIINNENQQNALLKEMLDQENQIVQQKAIFIQALNTYRNAVEDWKVNYILYASANGIFVYSGFLGENQQLQSGQIVGVITDTSNKYFVEMLIPQTNFGKVKQGQEVLLKFSSYPSQEFGSVRGEIDFIKSISTDSGYLSKVSLPNGLVTNYKRQLLFSEGLSANAEIITENRRLSDRLFGQIRDLLK